MSTTYVIREFLHQDHRYSRDFFEETINIVNAIVVTNLRSTISTALPTTRKIKNSASTESTLFFANWTIDAFVFRIATQLFYFETHQFRKIAIYQSFIRSRQLDTTMIESFSSTRDTSSHSEVSSTSRVKNRFLNFEELDSISRRNRSRIKSNSKKILTSTISFIISHNSNVDSDVSEITDSDSKSDSRIFDNLETIRISTKSTSNDFTKVQSVVRLSQLFKTSEQSNMSRNDDLRNSSTMQQLIVEVVTKTLANYNAQLTSRSLLSNLTGPSDLVRQSGLADSSESTKNNISSRNFNFRVSDLGYFHSNLEKIYEKEDIVIIDKEIIYREVYIFCRRVKDYAISIDEKKIRNNLFSCFRENALYWWLNSLTQDEKDAMTELSNDMRRILRRLKNRFRIFMSTAQNRLNKETYSFKDAFNGKKFYIFMQNVKLFATQTSFTKNLVKIIWAWNHLSLEFQIILSLSTFDITIRRFFELMANRKELWEKIVNNAKREKRKLKREKRKKSFFDRTREKSKQATDQDRRESKNRQEDENRLRHEQSSFLNLDNTNSYEEREFRLAFQRSYYSFYSTEFLNQYQSSFYFEYQFEFPQVNFSVQNAYINQQQQQSASSASFTNSGQNLNQSVPSIDNQRNARNVLSISRQSLMIIAENANPYQRAYSLMSRDFDRDNKISRYSNRLNPFSNNNLWMSAEQIQIYFEDSKKSISENWDDTSKAQVYHAQNYEYSDSSWENQTMKNRENDKNVFENFKFKKVEAFFVGVAYHVVIDANLKAKSTCRRCQCQLESNNKLHQHLRFCKDETRLRQFVDEVKMNSSSLESSSSHRVIVFSTSSIKNDDMTFRKWHFCISLINYSEASLSSMFCVDTECEMFMMNRAFVKIEISKTQIQKCQSISLRRIEATKYIFDEWFLLNIFLREKNEINQSIIIHLKREIHLIDNLKIKFLMSMNILRVEQIIVNLSNKKLRFDVCENVTVSCEIKARDSVRIRRIVRISRKQSISTRTTTAIFVALKRKSSLSKRDFLFELSIFETYVHFVNADIHFVNVRNDKNISIYLFERQRVGIIVKYETKECYLVNSENHSLAFILVEISHSLLFKIDSRVIKSTREVKKKLKIKMNNEITLYEKSKTIERLMKVVRRHLKIWENTEDIIDLSSKKHMKVLIITNWQTTIDVKLAHKIYSLSQEFKNFIDQKFDKMHAQDRLSWFENSTSFEFSIFVIWKTMYVSSKKTLERKERAVMNIRELNAIFIANSYSLSLQSDIITILQECTHIILVDESDQFHQFLIKQKHRDRFIIISHREKEIFNVALMRFKNSILYVQSKMNKFLRSYKFFARCYIDDIVIFSHSLKDHLTHLITIFDLFTKLHVFLKFKKFYIEYSSMTLLSQRVDELDLFTFEEKLVVIRELRFSKSLKNLKIYLEMFNWLRIKILYYAQIAQSLQDLRTELLKKSSTIDDRVRVQYCRNIKLSSTTSEEESFHMFQKVLTKESHLHHHNHNKRTYIDIDDFKKYDFEIHLYHVKKDLDDSIFNSTNIQTIMYLFKLLNKIEKNYWFTKLKVVALMWTLKKIRHLLAHNSKTSTIVFIDHSTTMNIVKQIKLFFSSSNRMNLRLIRISQYVSQFSLNIRWKSKKQNIVLDVLFRLLRKRLSQEESKKEDILNEVYVYHLTLVKMTSLFKKKLRKAYQTNKKWFKILKMLRKRRKQNQKSIVSILQMKIKSSRWIVVAFRVLSTIANDSTIAFRVILTISNDATILASKQVSTRSRVIISIRETRSVSEKSIFTKFIDDSELDSTKVISLVVNDSEMKKETRVKGIQFLLKESLIYYQDETNDRLRLCISKKLKKKFFELAHDNHSHEKFQRIYDKIVFNYYMRHLTRRLKRYIQHCFSCQLNQIKRHRTYESLKLIVTIFSLFHTIIIDFILALLKLLNEKNTLMSITDKFFKRVTTVIDKVTWNVETWVIELIKTLTNWEISKVIIFDRNSKFLFKLWKTIFQSLEIELFYFTAYHLQSNEQSERTNQIMKIALRYYLFNNSDENWKVFAIRLRETLNNAKNAFTRLFSNKMTYEKSLKNALSLIELIKKNIDFAVQRIKNRKNAIESIAFANAKMKVRYDEIHQSLVLQKRDQIFIKLHTEYKISSLKNSKLSNQRIDSFKILEAYEQLTYRLEISKFWFIHLVISIAMLKPASREKNSYERPREKEQLALEDQETNDVFELKRLIDKRITIKSQNSNKREMMQYLTKWKNWDLVHNKWYDDDDLSNARDLVQNYLDTYDLRSLREYQFSKAWESLNHRLRNVKLATSSVRAMTWEWVPQNKDIRQ